MLFAAVSQRGFSWDIRLASGWTEMLALIKWESVGLCAFCFVSAINDLWHDGLIRYLCRDNHKCVS